MHCVNVVVWYIANRDMYIGRAAPMKKTTGPLGQLSEDVVQKVHRPSALDPATAVPVFTFFRFLLGSSVSCVMERFRDRLDRDFPRWARDSL